MICYRIDLIDIFISLGKMGIGSHIVSFGWNCCGSDSDSDLSPPEDIFQHPLCDCGFFPVRINYDMCTRDWCNGCSKDRSWEYDKKCLLCLEGIEAIENKIKYNLSSKDVRFRKYFPFAESNIRPSQEHINEVLTDFFIARKSEIIYEWMALHPYNIFLKMMEELFAGEEEKRGQIILSWIEKHPLFYVKNIFTRVKGSPIFKTEPTERKKIMKEENIELSLLTDINLLLTEVSNRLKEKNQQNKR